MPTTRSATKQAKLEVHDDKVGLNDHAKSRTKTSSDTKSTDTKSTSKSGQSDSTFTSKRKAAPEKDKSENSSSKKPKTDDNGTPPKQQHFASSNAEDLEKPILINRSPVLQLWGAVVAQFLHPDLSWPACLSVGAAISALCAVSKGRSIGVIEPKDAEKDGKNDKATKNTADFSVMGFPMQIKGDAVTVDGKPKPLNEDTLKKKFGEQQYDQTKEAMEKSLKTWVNDKEELDKKAFHMYEKFRPGVAKGQQGWGRKGELNLHEVANVIKR